MLRVGLHCAPAAHRRLGTFPDGTVRVSIGPYTTEADVDALSAVGAVLSRWFVEDLDHLPVSMNLWRHLLHPLGAVAALCLAMALAGCNSVGKLGRSYVRRR